MKRRATSLLFAVVTGAPVAVIADSSTDAAAIEDTVAPVATPVVLPVAVPRVLRTGAPACGNVAIWKDPTCKQLHDDATITVSSIVSQVREIGSVLAVFDGFGDRSLTGRSARRPDS